MRKFLLILLLPTMLTACKSPPKPTEELITEIKEPEFEIVSISIIQDELINTKFEAIVRINNPNKFAVDLSSIKYELYGNGALWSTGTGKDVLHISGQGICETEFRFTMNFINMSRKLLDDVIAMRHVNYRFAGVAEVETGVPRRSTFQTSFDRSGFSEVRKKVDNTSAANRL